MANKGAGARIAWSIESNRVKKDLIGLMRGHLIVLLEFAEGESRRDAALSAYSAAGKTGSLAVRKFDDFKALSQAVRGALVHRPPEEPLDIFLQDSERKGVYRSNVEAVMQCAIDLLIYDGDAVLISSEDASHGILLDREEDGQGSTTFEFECW
jgi:hypothetical protein